MLWPRRVIFLCFERCSHTLHFPANGSTFIACPTQLRRFLNYKNTSASKSSCFEPKFLHDVSSLPFRIPVDCCDISSFSFIHNYLSFLLAVVPSDTNWQRRWSMQNKQRDAKWHHHEGRDKSRLKKRCWLATHRSSSCQVLLQLSPFLEGTARTFRRANPAVSSAVIISSTKMMHYFRKE